MSQFGKPLLAPVQVLVFFLGRIDHRLIDGLVTGRQSLSSIQALGRHFTGIIDPHQSGCMRTLMIVKFGCVFDITGRIAPGLPRRLHMTGVEAMLELDY